MCVVCYCLCCDCCRLTSCERGLFMLLLFLACCLLVVVRCVLFVACCPVLVVRCRSWFVVVDGRVVHVVCVVG